MTTPDQHQPAEGGPAPKPAPLWRPRNLALAAIVAALVAAAASVYIASRDHTEAPVASARPQPLTLSVRGTLSLYLPNFVWSSKTLTCTGRAGHDDIAGGAQVVVTDPAGVNLAVGRLDAGRPQIDPDDNSRATECMFSFQVDGAPSGKKVYGVEVSHRGKAQFEEADLDDFIALELA